MNGSLAYARTHALPIPTLHDHGPNSLTLATVRVSSYPKPYGPRNPIIELGLQIPTLATEVGGAGKGQRSHRAWEAQCFRTHPRNICYGLEKTLMRFMTTAPLHTVTQRPQMTSGRVIWPLFFFFFLNDHTLSRKKYHK